VGSPVEGGKFAIIDGQHRTTSAAIVGYESVPCQIVIAAKEEQAAAFKAINGTTTPISIMALHAAALVACEPWAVQIAHVCACAEVELLRYPVPSDKQSPGQTMAVGAIAQCLKRYGEATLITALQCVTDNDEVEITGLHPAPAPSLKRDEATAALDDGESDRDPDQLCLSCWAGQKVNASNLIGSSCRSRTSDFSSAEVEPPRCFPDPGVGRRSG
jgi:hypothetical protein